MFKLIRNIIITTILVLLIICGYVTYEGYQMYKEAINKTSIEDKIAEIKENTENYTKYEELPKQYVDAVLAVEDRRFFEHRSSIFFWHIR